eukprot:860627_1
MESSKLLNLKMRMHGSMIKLIQIFHPRQQRKHPIALSPSTTHGLYRHPVDQLLHPMLATCMGDSDIALFGLARARLSQYPIFCNIFTNSPMPDSSTQSFFLYFLLFFLLLVFLLFV